VIQLEQMDEEEQSRQAGNVELQGLHP